jgi:hypothetical protein
MGTSAATAHMRDTVTGELEVGTALGSSRYFHPNRSIDSFNIYLRTKRRINHADVFVRENQVPFARKFLVWFDAEIYIQVTLGPATDRFASFAKADRSAIIDTGGNFDSDILALAFGPFTMTDRAWLFRDLAAAVASLTDDLLLNGAEHSIHNACLLAGALAGRTGFHFVARLHS